MIDPQTTQRMIYRLAYVGVTVTLIGILILPLDTRPVRIPGPDLLMCLTFAWIQRRPDFVPPLLLVGMALLADFLLMRPPGLWTLLLFLGAEYLRGRNDNDTEQTFLEEWLFTTAVIIAITLLNALLLSIFAVPHIALGKAAIAMVMSIIFYPLVVLFSEFVLKLGQPSTAEQDN